MFVRAMASDRLAADRPLASCHESSKTLDHCNKFASCMDCTVNE